MGKFDDVLNASKQVVTICTHKHEAQIKTTRIYNALDRRRKGMNTFGKIIRLEYQWRHQ